METISKERYEELKTQSAEGNKANDYNKMIMAGSKEYNEMRKYEQEHICQHKSVRSEQGGQIDICNYCGKTWG